MSPDIPNGSCATAWLSRDSLLGKRSKLTEANELPRRLKILSKKGRPQPMQSAGLHRAE